MIGRRIKLQALLDSVPKLVSTLSPSREDAHHAAVGITTTDLVSKSAAIEVTRTLAPALAVLLLLLDMYFLKPMADAVSALQTHLVSLQHSCHIFILPLAR